MASTHGTQQTKEMLVAMKEVACIVQKAKKAADAKGTGVAGIGTELVPLLMGNPAVLAKLQVAAQGASEIPAELKDLQFGEIMDLIAEAGKLAQEAASEIAA